VATLNYREAARRVRRSIRTIKRWRLGGMPMGWEIQHGQQVRVVDEEVLLAWWRERLELNPAHQYRLRRILAAAAERQLERHPD
jgi:transposase